MTFPLAHRAILLAGFLLCDAATGLVLRAREEDGPRLEAPLPDEEPEEGAAPPPEARRHQEAMCARLDDLLKRRLKASERRKATETRKSLHCAPPRRQAPKGRKT